MRTRIRNCTKRRWFAAAMILAVGSFGWRSRTARGSPLSTVKPGDAIRYADELSQAFEDAAAAIRPSLVSIRATEHFRPTAQNQRVVPRYPGLPDWAPFHGDGWIQRFFSFQLPESRPSMEGVGSGVIVSSDGYILTNSHVVANADRVMVTLGDKREVRAERVGVDPMTDLAVLKIKEPDLKPAQLGDSETLKVGEWVVAAGSPFGLSETITAGIVSAKGRANVHIAEYEDFIQTDAAINPGNSGGPLVNVRGEVVGINTAIASHNGGNNGVGFAIPINMAKSVMNHLIHDGHVVRGWLGIGIQPLDEPLAKSFGYGSTEGVLVGDVLPNGPAAEAGIEQGDIIVKLDSGTVTDVAQLRNAVATMKPGSRATLVVFRDGRSKSVTVDIGKLEDSGFRVATDADLSEEMGLAVEDATPETDRAMGVRPDVRGAVVTELDTGGIADQAGLHPGDVILEVQGERTNGASEFRDQLAHRDLRSGVRLLVQSGDLQHFVLLQEQS